MQNMDKAYVQDNLEMQNKTYLVRRKHKLNVKYEIFLILRH